MNKINAEHLARKACVYVRQSTPDQVQNNLESQRRQYALAELSVAHDMSGLGSARSVR